ncbi:MAG: TadE/TadG family type IV pilus assembly protein [Nitrolancea sp.]
MPRRWRAQATLEFAIVSILFFMMVFGTFDIGRGVYMYSELTNSVREGARYGQVSPSDSSGIKQHVVDKSPGLGLSTSDVTVTCSTTCASGNDITVKADLPFSLITQNLLGISPITMHASATDAID